MTLDHPSSTNTGRRLEDYDDSHWSEYLVDKHGNSYEPYSLAWRFLGMFTDCDLNDDEGGRRQLNNDNKDGHNNNNEEEDCATKKLLWAAYHDPHYRGHGIREYQFYDWESSTWDTSTCSDGDGDGDGQGQGLWGFLGRGCRKMNCHDPGSTHFQLVGIFKETDGIYDWAEQLFKHEGYCVWDGDKEGDGEGGKEGGNNNNKNNNKDSSGDYEFMQGILENWSQDGCKKLQLKGSDGNAVYYGALPLPDANVTFATFDDEDCTTVSTTTTLSDYIIKYYTYYYYDSDTGYKAAQNHEWAMIRWNELLNSFKICQPCRAYNRIPTYGDDHDNNGDENNNNNDGQGAEEPNGFNCYDDAGYRNCNQCYKFETHSSLEPATSTDLARASAQGTILRIRALDGQWYGQDASFYQPESVQMQHYLVTAVGMLFATTLVAILTYVVLVGSRRPPAGGMNLKWMEKLGRRRRGKRRILGPGMNESLYQQEEEEDGSVAGSSKVVERERFDDEIQEGDDEDEDDDYYPTNNGLFACGTQHQPTILERELKRKNQLLQRQQDHLERLQFELDQEKILRKLQNHRSSWVTPQPQELPEPGQELTYHHVTLPEESQANMGTTSSNSTNSTTSSITTTNSTKPNVSSWATPRQEPPQPEQESPYHVTLPKERQVDMDTTSNSSNTNTTNSTEPDVASCVTPQQEPPEQKQESPYHGTLPEESQANMETTSNSGSTSTNSTETDVSTRVTPQQEPPEQEQESPYHGTLPEESQANMDTASHSGSTTTSTTSTEPDASSWVTPQRESPEQEQEQESPYHGTLPEESQANMDTTSNCGSTTTSTNSTEPDASSWVTPQRESPEQQQESSYHVTLPEESQANMDTASNSGSSSTTSSTNSTEPDASSWVSPQGEPPEQEQEQESPYHGTLPEESQANMNATFNSGTTTTNRTEPDVSSWVTRQQEPPEQEQESPYHGTLPEESQANMDTTSNSTTNNSTKHDVAVVTSDAEDEATEPAEDSATEDSAVIPSVAMGEATEPAENEEGACSDDDEDHRASDSDQEPSSRNTATGTG
ncbi:hypothetical protein ACA910_002048 [Epithemia clementina (nom. ined.)]